MQSIENKIQTELVATAMRIAAEALKVAGHADTGPHSPLGLLRRGLVVREQEIRARG